MLILRRYAYRGTELVVIPQPDGSLACIPAWMMRAAATRFKLSAEPRFSLGALQSLRAEIDALLGLLQSDSTTEKDPNEAPIRSPQPSLFEVGEPSVVLTSQKETELAMLVETLLREIATALANGEIANDQDHG
ncbi:hypothetical protein [Mesorhizobium sp. M0684]|uniref:hypothetical protein n=1 Tax=Mesorhizobium sp. M0684 TaxID=2956986 RepID=UPI00333AD5D7